ncbi:hypothetical protein RG47T_5172 [Mucilaginibacter polytrichastri]|uniref:PAS domain-containing protein n=1 Tax=Mucilaginibacter polytrichastri TaxID=1302689 RepID=A0A1Q6A6P3_9SPHI|nr:hypothetical protein RG47T_5172 [Mucilaginibacter polytrichastri]
MILKAEMPDFPVVAQNDHYRFLSNQKVQSSLGKRAFELFVPNPQDERSLHAYTVLLTAFQTCIEKKTIIKLPPIFQVNTPEGEIWLQTDVIPVFGSNSSVEFLMCQTYDISKQIFLKAAALDGVKREQSLSDDLAATNEELSASNEELMASVEELRQSQESLFESNRELENRVEERTKAFTDSEARFRIIVEQSPVPMLVTMGEAMIFNIINQPMLDLIGKDESVIGMPWHEAMPELEGQDIISQLLDTYDSGNAG